MKRLTVLLLCFLMLCTCSLPVYAATPSDEATDTVISLTVPDTHKVTVEADGANVFYEGERGEEFTVGRLSMPKFLINSWRGTVIEKVYVNGEDVTEQMQGDYLELTPVYEDKVITVTTKLRPPDLAKTYTDGERVAIDDVPMPDVVLQQDGSCVETMNSNSTDIESHLELNEGANESTDAQTGIIEPNGVISPQTGDTPNWMLWLILLILCAIGMVIVYKMKKTR